MDSVGDQPHGLGLPHSEIRESTSARLSSRLFAACHVLHRLSVPRHPPDALITLDPSPATLAARRDKPCLTATNRFVKTLSCRYPMAPPSRLPGQTKPTVPTGPMVHTYPQCQTARIRRSGQRSELPRTERVPY